MLHKLVLRLQLISRIIYHYTTAVQEVASGHYISPVEDFLILSPGKISEEVQISKRKEKDYMYIYSTFKLCDETVAQ